jgi:hypothetical protein
MKSWLRFAVFFVVLSCACYAYGYILPSKQILSFMSDQVGRKGTLVVIQKTVFYDPTLEGGMQELEETLYYKPPGKFRKEAHAVGVEKIHVCGPGGVLTVMEGKVVGESEGPYDHFKDPFLFKDPGALAEAFSRAGVDTGTVSLGRFKDQIAFVIGAHFPDTSVPQIWVDKDSFRPIRFVFGAGNGGPVREIQYLEYRSIEKGKSYPTRILFYENDVLVRMQVLESFDINTDISDDLFDVAYLKGLYEPAAPPPTEPSEVDQIKKTIQDFKKIFE